MRNDEPSATLLHLLRDAHHLVESTSFPFELPDSGEAHELKARLAARISTHLLPRLTNDDAPAVVVLGGSTGAGKSTILNSVAREDISPAGVIRPTTTRAVVAHNPAMRHNPLDGVATPVAHRAIPETMVVVDAPDLDSLEETNREIALALLDAADMWVFVTSAARYGDQLPWSTLVRAKERGLQVAVVLNRIPAAARATVRADLLTRLDKLGMGSAPLFLIPDISPHEGPLPLALVQEFSDWLRAAAGRHQSRGVIRRTTTGVWRSIHDGLLRLAEAVGHQARAAARLGHVSLAAVRGPLRDLDHVIDSGEVAQGAPTTRWLALASAGGVLAPLADRSAKVRRGFRGAARAARTDAVHRLALDVRDGVVTLLADAIQDAAAATREEWRKLDAAHLLGDIPAVTPAAARESARAAVDLWWHAVLGLLDSRDLAPSDRMKALFAPAGVRDLVVAGAVGVPGAAAVCDELVDSTICADARNLLRETAQQTVSDAATPYLTRVRSLPSADMATRLRVRASELKGHIDDA